MKKEIAKEHIHAVCPNCSREIDTVWVCKLDSVIGVRYVYFCGNCQKTLGVSHHKEFELAVTTPGFSKSNLHPNHSIN